MMRVAVMKWKFLLAHAIAAPTSTMSSKARDLDAPRSVAISPMATWQEGNHKMCVAGNERQYYAEQV